MTITDDLLEGARALRDALDALEFSMKSTVLQLDDLFTVRRETSGRVFFPLTNEHSGKLAVYVLERHDDHTHVNFVLRVRPVDPETL